MSEPGIIRQRVNNGLRFVGQDTFVPYVLVIPIALALLLIFVYPLLNGFYLSFLDRQNEFVGFAHYKRLFNDPEFWNALFLTLLYVVGYSLGVFFVGFVTSLISDTASRMRLRGATVLEYIVTIPYAIPDVVAALIWFWMFDLQLGIVNHFVQLSGLIQEPIPWLTSKNFALLSVLIVTVWRLFPLHTLILLAAFKTVPYELYEAANMDGASAVRKFFQITLPSTWHVINLLLLLTIVWSFKRFTILWLLTQGGPGHASETAVIYLYRWAFQFFRRNYAAAVGVIMFILVAVISIAYYRSRSRGSTK